MKNLILGVLVLLLVVFLLTGCSSVKEGFNDTVNNEDKRIEDLVYDYTRYNEVQDVKYNAIDDKNILIVKMKVSPSYSNDATIHSCSSDMMKIIENLKDNKKYHIDLYDFWFVADMENSKGNVEELKVIQTSFKKDTIDELNWDNITSKKFINLADESWIYEPLR